MYRSSRERHCPSFARGALIWNSVHCRKEVMATTTEHMEDAYEKLHRWVMFDFRTYSRDAQLEVSDVTRQAVKRLRERRDLLE